MSEELRIKDLDNLILAYKQAEHEHREAKDIATKKWEDLCALEAKILAALEASGKSRYYLDEVGTVFTSTSLNFRTPKEMADKKRLIAWINKKYGEEGVLGQVTFNYQSLNGFLRREFEAAAERGDATFSIPGIEPPTSDTRLCVRKT